MTRLFTEGFEAGDVLAWDSATGSSSTSPVRIGGRAGRTNNQSFPKVVTAGTEFYVRSAVYLESGGVMNITWLNSGTTLGSVRQFNHADGQRLDLYTGTATLVASTTRYWSTGVWIVIEIHVKLADSGGIIELKADNVLVASFYGDTKPGADTTINKFSFGSSSFTNFDDIAINDTNGGSDNSWCGDAHIYALTPNGNGTTNNFTGSDGNSTDNYLLVDEIPYNSDTDYVQSATSTHKDLYAFTNLPSLPSGSVISRVIVETRARELTADGQAIKVGVKSGATESWSSNITLTTAYARQSVEFINDPATSAAWTESAVNALEAGVQVP